MESALRMYGCVPSTLSIHPYTHPTSHTHVPASSPFTTYPIKIQGLWFTLSIHPFHFISLHPWNFRAHSPPTTNDTDLLMLHHVRYTLLHHLPPLYTPHPRHFSSDIFNVDPTIVYTRFCFNTLLFISFSDTSLSVLDGSV